MKSFTASMFKSLLSAGFLFGVCASASGQNVFSGEPVQVVGQFNTYSTLPYNADYRTTVYRTVSTSGGNPTDGRGQWATTIQVPAGDANPTNMTGGGGAGFLFISGPSGNRFQNKWVFSGIAQGSLNAINNITAFNSGVDMGLNMSTSGHYTFVLNDAGYTTTNAKYYVGFTSAAPVDIVSVSSTPNSGGTATVEVTTSASLSPEENVYVRYTTGANFAGSGSSSLVQVSMTGTSGTATIPSFPVGQTVRYYVFSSTRTLAQLNANSETDRTLATLRYNDNSNGNYTYLALPVELTSFTARVVSGSVVLSWATATEHNNSHFDVQRSADSRNWQKITTMQGMGTTLLPHAYEVTDERAPAGILLYRLQQVDFDGAVTFSDIRKVEVKKQPASFLLYPNPASGEETWLEFSEKHGTSLVRLFDMKGTLLREWTCDIEGVCRVRLDLSGLPDGNMLLSVDGQKGVWLVK